MSGFHALMIDEQQKKEYWDGSTAEVLYSTTFGSRGSRLEFMEV